MWDTEVEAHARALLDNVDKSMWATEAEVRLTPMELNKITVSIAPAADAKDKVLAFRPLPSWKGIEKRRDEAVNRKMGQTPAGMQGSVRHSDSSVAAAAARSDLRCQQEWTVGAMHCMYPIGYPHVWPPHPASNWAVPGSMWMQPAPCMGTEKRWEAMPPVTKLPTGVLCVELSGPTTPAVWRGAADKMRVVTALKLACDTAGLLQPQELMQVQAQKNRLAATSAPEAHGVPDRRYIHFCELLGELEHRTDRKSVV